MELQRKHKENQGGNYGGGTLSDTLTGNGEPIANVERSRVYYKGEGGDFPQVQAMLSLVCPCCPRLVLAPKVLQLCTNHFVWVVCRLV
jgi:hypothetical protein